LRGVIIWSAMILRRVLSARRGKVGALAEQALGAGRERCPMWSFGRPYGRVAGAHGPIPSAIGDAHMDRVSTQGNETEDPRKRVNCALGVAGVGSLDSGRTGPDAPADLITLIISGRFLHTVRTWRLAQPPRSSARMDRNALIRRRSAREIDPGFTVSLQLAKMFRTPSTSLPTLAHSRGEHALS
jgi:hypothetical protein